MQERVGVIGLGRMGQAIAARLVAQGVPVTGWNRSPRPGLDLPLAESPEALVATCETLLLCLFDDAAVAEILARLQGCDLTARLVVEMSTVSPAVLRGAEDGLRARGAALVDAPISGGPGMMLDGTAGLFLGGTPEDVARFQPLAAKLTDRRVPVGGLGAGATAKIVNNMMLVSYWQALKEALSLGKAAGLDPLVTLAFLAKSPTANLALEQRMDVIRGDSDAVGFALDGVVKDGALAQGLAEALGVPTPALNAGWDSFAAASAKGLGEADLAVMVRDAWQSAKGPGD